MIDHQVAQEVWDARTCPLTAREREVLQLCAEGEDDIDIAARLFLTHRTVRNYLTSAVTKLSARNRIDAIRVADDWGWI